MIGCKIFEKKEYAEQFMDGKIYISAAGRFSKATDAQRQYAEGMTPAYNKSVVIDDKKFDIPYSYGYLEVDRIPVFCCTVLDADNLEIKDGVIAYSIPQENKKLGSILFCLI